VTPSGGKQEMSRTTMTTLLILIAAALLAVALFIAGAMWRGRVSRGHSSLAPSMHSIQWRRS